MASCSTLTGQQPRSSSYLGVPADAGKAAERLKIEKTKTFMVAGGLNAAERGRELSSGGGGGCGAGGSPLLQIAE